MSCIAQCFHHTMTADLLDLASYEEQAIAKQKKINNPTTRAMSERRDFIGSLAQNGVKEIFDQHHIALEGWSPYFDPMKDNDEWDYKYRGLACDIKGTPLRGSVFQTTGYLVSDHQQSKYVDRYVFVSIDLDGKMIHVAGLISFSRFWEEAKVFNNPNMKSPAHRIEARQLDPFQKHIT